MPSIKKTVNRILNLIYPPRCAFCNQIINDSADSESVCTACRNSLPFCIKQPCCIKCGIPLKHNASAQTCGECERSEKSFARNISALIYKDSVKRSVFGYKKQGKRRYAKVYATYTAGIIGYYYKDIPFDYVINVPTSKKSIRRSGFDHGEELARNVADKIKVPYLPHALTKTRTTENQKRLSRHERELNLIGAFKAQNTDKIKEKRVLIIDDVFTTGSTINECCYILLKSGAAEVYSATLAITPKK